MLPICGHRLKTSTMNPRRCKSEYHRSMGTRATVVIYVLALVAVVVSVDVLFLRHNFLARLIVNIGIVLVFAVFYLAFLKGR